MIYQPLCFFSSPSRFSSFGVLVGFDPIFLFLLLIPVIRQVNIAKGDGSGWLSKIKKRVDEGQGGIIALVISFVLDGRFDGRFYGYVFPLLLLRRYAGM